MRIGHINDQLLLLALMQLISDIADPLHLMPAEERDEILTFLDYPEQSVGRLMLPPHHLIVDIFGASFGNVGETGMAQERWPSQCDDIRAHYFYCIFSHVLYY